MKIYLALLSTLFLSTAALATNVGITGIKLVENSRATYMVEARVCAQYPSIEASLTSIDEVKVLVELSIPNDTCKEGENRPLRNIVFTLDLQPRLEEIGFSPKKAELYFHLSNDNNQE